jgi:hypothetical protein
MTRMSRFERLSALIMEDINRWVGGNRKFARMRDCVPINASALGRVKRLSSKSPAEHSFNTIGGSI